jgi:NAD(P)H-dependent FMN reductase
MKIPRILAFAGSARTGSFNKKLLRVAVDGARAAGAEVTLLDLRDLPMPLYDQDLEAASGIDANAREFKKLLYAHQGLLIASPENNSSFSALLKNAIDWASRAEKGEAALGCFSGKTAAIMSASPGGLGGLRGLVHLRALLGNIRMLVLPEQIAIARAHEAFTDEGQLKDAGQQAAVEKIGARLAEVTARLLPDAGS